jgi:inositol phosphorylceramide mannosyltransferase catalytic subunit
MFKIPKIIHQIWLGPNTRPDIWMNSWKNDYCEKYPDWEYKLWTEKEINDLELINKDEYEYETFYNGKSDIIRYEILKKYGGIFMDSDSLWIKESKLSINDILKRTEKYGFFCAKEPKNNNIYANGVIGSIPNHKIMNDMINHIKYNYFELKKKIKLERQIWQVTGTYHFSNIVNTNYKNYNNVLILEHTYFFPVSFHQNNLNEDTSKLHIKYPNAIMFQYGYTTNNILNNNCMKKFIDNTKKLQ